MSTSQTHHLSARMSSDGVSSLTNTHLYPCGAFNPGRGGSAGSARTSFDSLMPFRMAARSTSYSTQTASAVPIAPHIQVKKAALSRSICSRAKSIGFPPGAECIYVGGWLAQSNYNVHSLNHKNREERACLQALSGAVGRARRRAAPIGGVAAFVKSLVLSALPLGNHGEIYAKGRSV